MILKYVSLKSKMIHFGKYSFFSNRINSFLLKQIRLKKLNHQDLAWILIYKISVSSNSGSEKKLKVQK